MNGTITCPDHNGKPHMLPLDKFTFRPAVYGILTEQTLLCLVFGKLTSTWEFPGGGVRINETAPDALVREFYEETGLEVVTESQVHFSESYFYAGDRDQAWHTLRFVYRVRKTGGMLKPDGNGDDILRAKYWDVSKLNEDETEKPLVFDVLKKLGMR